MHLCSLLPVMFCILFCFVVVLKLSLMNGSKSKWQ